MASPSDVIAWECGACVFTNDDCTRRSCQLCRTERPEQYFVVPGAGAAATARTTMVDRRQQARLAALHDVVEDAPATRTDEEEQPIAEGVPVVRTTVSITVPNRQIALEHLMGTLVDIVGTTINNRGRSCPHHSCCGLEVVEKSTVAFRREQMVFRDQREEDVIAVYLVLHGVLTCKVGFLPAHLNHRARDYDGLIARVMSVYSDRSTNVVKRQKFRRNHGCCVAKIIGENIY